MTYPDDDEEEDSWCHTCGEELENCMCPCPECGRAMEECECELPDDVPWV